MYMHCNVSMTYFGSYFFLPTWQTQIYAAITWLLDIVICKHTNRMPHNQPFEGNGPILQKHMS